jgi:hypothetical protein
VECSCVGKGTNNCEESESIEIAVRGVDRPTPPKCHWHLVVLGNLQFYDEVLGSNHARPMLCFQPFKIVLWLVSFSSV